VPTLSLMVRLSGSQLPSRNHLKWHAVCPSLVLPKSIDTLSFLPAGMRLDGREIAMTNETEASPARVPTWNTTADKLKNAVADQLKSAAASIEEKATSGQAPRQLAEYGQKAADWLDSSGDYVRNIDPNQVKLDIENKVRKNPGRSLLIAGAAGLFLGILVRRRPW
jgi:ElaB/YqjD/DUF883 family membrane-anchored ribosome-binding protein